MALWLFFVSCFQIRLFIRGKSLHTAEFSSDRYLRYCALYTLLGQWNLYCQLIYWEWYTFLMLTQLCHMGSFLGAIHTPTKIFSKCRKELLELLQILVIVSLAVKNLKSYKYSHYHRNTFFPCLFLWTRTVIFYKNSEIHDCNTHFKDNLHLPSSRLTMVQRGVLFSGSKIYNHLPSNIKEQTYDNKLFKLKLKRYLIEQTFYSLDEYYQQSLE